MRVRTMFATVACVAAIGCAPSQDAQLEVNKDLVRQFAAVLNAADWDALVQIVADDFVRHSDATAGPAVDSRDKFIELQQSFLASFPDQQVTIQRLVAEGDHVAGLATYRGTHEGPMGEFAATGRSVESTFLSIFRIEEGKIVELWVEWDNVAMLTQLGLFPPPPTGG